MKMDWIRIQPITVDYSDLFIKLIGTPYESDLRWYEITLVQRSRFTSDMTGLVNVIQEGQDQNQN